MKVCKIFLLFIILSCSSQSYRRFDNKKFKNKGISQIRVECIDGFSEMKRCKDGTIGRTIVHAVPKKKMKLFGKSISYSKLQGAKGWKEGMIIPTHYKKINMWRTDYAMVKRHGEDYFRNYDINSSSEDKTEFKKMNGPYVYKKGNDDIGSYLYLGDKGKPVREVMNALSLWFANSFAKGPKSGVAFSGNFSSVNSPVVIRHIGENGEYDVVYTRDFIPLTPPLPKIKRFSGNLIGVVLDEKDEVFWPILNDGTVPIQPEDLIGIRDAGGHRTPSGHKGIWGVLWKTERGERWAYVNAPSKYAIENNKLLNQVLSSRSKAFFIDKNTITRDVKTFGNKWKKMHALSRISKDGPYYIADLKTGEPVEGEIYKSPKEAYAEYRKRKTLRRSKELAERRAYFEKKRKLMEEAKKRSAIATAKHRAARSNREFAISGLIKDKKFKDAAIAAREFGATKVSSVVIQAIKWSRGSDIEERDLRTARANQSGLSRFKKKLDTLIKRKENRRYWAQQRNKKKAYSPGWRPTYRKNNYKWKAAKTNSKSYSEIMKDVRFRQSIKYIKGQSSWKYGSGSVRDY